MCVVSDVYSPAVIKIQPVCVYSHSSEECFVKYNNFFSTFFFLLFFFLIVPEEKIMALALPCTFINQNRKLQMSRALKCFLYICIDLAFSKAVHLISLSKLTQCKGKKTSRCALHSPRFKTTQKNIMHLQSYQTELLCQCLTTRGLSPLLNIE